MQLASPSRPDPAVTDVATAVRDALRVLGHGPAITMVLPSGRQEQGMASLAQWAAKGAHLLEADLLLEPGDQLRLDAPLSWGSAAVCLAAWWAGVVITTEDDAEVAVVHELRLGTHHGADADLFILGDAIDGGPDDDHGPEPWVRAVQAFPDRPPPPRGTAGTPALVADGRTWNQQELLERARALEPGTMGVEAESVPAWLGLIAVAIRPLVAGRPTVVVRGVGRDAADGDNVVHWL